MTDSFPTYEQLPVIEKTGFRHAWQAFGAGDQIGALNFITPEVVAAAAREVVAGEVVNLNLPLDMPNPPLSRGRQNYRWEMKVHRGGRDDWMDNFYLQGSTQWDGLRHIRYREFGYWGGRQDEDVDAGTLGIEHWARRGLISRGVLADVAAYLEQRGTPIDPTARVPIGVDLLDATLAWEGVTLRQGDVLLVRTGWMAWYLGLGPDGRQGLAGTLHNEPGGLDCPGIDPAEASAAWLWNHRVAAIAADNPALETLKIDGAIGFLHRRVLPLLGMPIGEFWDLEGLSSACRRHRRYAFLLSASPLNLSGGVGSPANAYAVL